MNFNLPVPVHSFLFYYGVVFISLFITYGIGWVIKFCLFKMKESISAFSILTSSVLGLTVTITIYSIIVTKGLTVNWMLLVLFAMYLYYRRKNKENSTKVPQPHAIPGWKYMLIIALINIIFFCFFMYRIIDFEHGMFRPFFGDFNYYAKSAQYLNLGYENRCFEYNFFKFMGIDPYHYFEIWTNAIIYKYFGLNALVVYTVSIPMYFNTLIFTSLLAIIEFRKKITFEYVIFSFTILLLSDTIPYFSYIIPAFKGWMPLLESPKLLPVFLFLFTAIILFIKNKKTEAYFVLLALPVTNIISIIAVWGTIGCLLFFNNLDKCKIEYKYWIPFLSVIFLYGVYALSSSSQDMVGEPFHWGLLRLYITQPVVYITAYIHVLILIFFLDKKQLRLLFNSKVGKIVGVAFFLSMTISILMRPYNYNATQFVTGSITVLVFVLIVVAFLTVITTIQFSVIKKSILFCFCIISLLISYHSYLTLHSSYSVPFSYKYESTILENLPSKQEEYHIGFYIGENVLADEIGASGVGELGPSGIVDAITIPDVLDYYHNNVFHYSINKGNREVKYSTDNTPFRDYYVERKKNSPDISDDDIRIDFIKENAIEYIRIFSSASPSDIFLSNLILVAEDSISGERFYKVKNSSLQ